MNKREEDFDNKRKELIDNIDDVINKYNDFSKKVTPRNWRITGHHIVELRKIKEELKTVNPMSESEWETLNNYLT